MRLRQQLQWIFLRIANPYFGTYLSLQSSFRDINPRKVPRLFLNDLLDVTEMCQRCKKSLGIQGFLPTGERTVLELA